MDTIKTAALTFIAIVTCLMLLQAPEPRQTESIIQILAPANQNQAVKFEPIQVVAPDQPESEELDQPNHALTTSISEQATEEPLFWYPELEQIKQLENAPATQAIFELGPMLSNRDPVIRLAAIESLGDMTDQATLPALSAALEDPNPQLRIAALEALASQKDESAVISIEAYLFDPDREVRVAAIEALADLEVETAVHSLAGLLSDQDSLIRHHAVNALGEIGGENAMMYLLQARHDPDATIRVNAVAILEELEYEATY
jgi:HEAT repeat protein